MADGETVQEDRSVKNTFGNILTLTLFGESHGPAIGAVIDGLPPGIAIDEEYIRRQMDLRRPYGDWSTARREDDGIVFLSGVKDGISEGTPIAFLIGNNDIRRSDYAFSAARPSHADYAAHEKYLGYEDRSGGGHFSGRLTAPLTAAGAIVRKALEDKGILIGSHIAVLHGIKDRDLNDYETEIPLLNEKTFAVLDEEAGERMKQEIVKAASEKDSLGGILETVLLGIPAGIGEPFFDSFESMLGHGIFSIPGVKGLEFGDGFALAGMKGSEANDAFRNENGKIITKTNHSGGINGGLANGSPIVFRTVFKPASSIGKKQETIDLYTKENTEIELNGRHDPAIIHRGRIVVESIAAWVIADLLMQRYGTLYLRKEK